MVENFKYENSWDLSEINNLYEGKRVRFAGNISIVSYENLKLKYPNYEIYFTGMIHP